MTKITYVHVTHVLKLCLILLFSTLLAFALSHVGVGNESIIMVFLIGVLLITVASKGYLYGFIASLVSVFIFNFFFTEPIHSFTAYKSSDIVLMVSFFIASLISGLMTKMFQKQLMISKRNEQTARLLHGITESFLNLTGQQTILLNGIRKIHQYTQSKCQVEMADELEPIIDEAIGTDSVGDAYSVTKLPIIGLTRQLGTLHVFRQSKAFTFDHELVIKTVVTQMGLALDREMMYIERQNIRIAMEREELRTNLIRAVSHDLRTPLTGIIGASAVIIDNIDNLALDHIRELAANIHEESNWLINFVENILNMTRIEDGKLLLEKNFEVVDDVVFEAVKHASKLSKTRKIETEIPEEIETISMDSQLIVQVLVNLLDNAIKHTDDGCRIVVRVYRQESNAVFEVADDGKGIDENKRESLFDSFVTIASKANDGKKGMGLGLAICKSIIEAHGGAIYCLKAPEGGALFRFTLPISEGV